MKTFTTIEEVRTFVRTARHASQRIAFVPTMGNLHDGHMALVKAAKKHADVVITSIFVNPIQFGPNEDLESYPRTLTADRQALETVKCDGLFLPTVDTLSPNGMDTLTKVHVPGPSEGLCATSRPNHFDGVSTVVSILFNIVQPDIACFGKKDYQQLAIIRKMVDDLHLPIEIIGVDTVRESSGLALSSRNGYLDDEQHQQAANLQRVLKMAESALLEGTPRDTVLIYARTELETQGFEVDYLELRRKDLSPLGVNDLIEGNAILLAAAYLGSTRLLDNREIKKEHPNE
ncbi:Pantothenate synthetase [Halomonadaceae bacterium LMG 33818]|uniref:pantoate--beta-alanine ligase n=1 Tax=Cernens ardua TaxID=3402176 RepID=UPI003EDC88D2